MAQAKKDPFREKEESDLDSRIKKRDAERKKKRKPNNNLDTYMNGIGGQKFGKK